MNYFYYTAAGEKIGPVNGKTLRELVRESIVRPETVIENEKGRRALAKDVKGLLPDEASVPVPPVATATVDDEMVAKRFPAPPMPKIDPRPEERNGGLWNALQGMEERTRKTLLVIMAAVWVFAVIVSVWLLMRPVGEPAGVVEAEPVREVEATDTGVDVPIPHNAATPTISMSDAGIKRSAEKFTLINESEPLSVHFIDVGQGDSILVRTPDNRTMLIDAGGDNGKAEDYLRLTKIKVIDVLVATHPHLDHIGGMSNIVKEYDVKKVVMPRFTTTTRTYENLLEAIKEKGLRITAANPGINFPLGDCVSIQCVAPNSDKYRDDNDYSAVIKLTHGDSSFLFTGDATEESEGEMIRYHKSRLKSSVLKIGHHGSKTSSSIPFLNSVSPEMAVISVGPNSYGHPSPSVLERLDKVKVFRTDVHGTIIISTDGKSITAKSSVKKNLENPLPCQSTTKKQESQFSPPPDIPSRQEVSRTVYVTRTGSKYHAAGCRYLKSSIPMSLEDARKRYSPCSVCKP